MNSSITRNAKVTVSRSDVATRIATELPSFIFWNVGTVHKVSGNRVYVGWAGAGAFWFDADQVKLATAAAALA